MMSKLNFKPSIGDTAWRLMHILIIVTFFVLLGGTQNAYSQTFDSGSDDSDGALNLTTPGTIDFDPGALGLDTDGDNIYHFTTITIGAGVTVRLSHPFLNAPQFWLASGAVQIDGIIDLNGGDGQDGQDVLNDAFFIPSPPGAGGFSGGAGGTLLSSHQPGNGPGGGGAGGGGAGHSGVGGRAAVLGGSSGGPAYGSKFLVPLMGGSGGGGGFRTTSATDSSGSGGSGGGSLLIASSTSIIINGTIKTDGGKGGDGSTAGGGGGSGGAIRLAATIISGAGTLSAIGGGGGFPTTTPWVGGSGSSGRIRLEAHQHLFTGNANPLHYLALPLNTFLPATPAPSLRVVSVTDAGGAKLVPAFPTASLTIPDVTIDDPSPVTVDIEASNIPVGTVVQLHLLSESVRIQIVDSTPLAGTVAHSTATVTVTIPSGFSRGFVRATWTPPAP